MQTNSSPPSSQTMTLRMNQARTISPGGEAADRRRQGLPPLQQNISNTGNTLSPPSNSTPEYKEVGAFMNLKALNLDFDNVRIVSSSYNTSGGRNLALINQTGNDITVSSSGEPCGLNIESYSFNQSDLPAEDDKDNVKLVDKAFTGMQLGGKGKIGPILQHASRRGSGEGMRAKLGWILSGEAIRLFIAVALSISVSIFFLRRPDSSPSK